MTATMDRPATTTVPAPRPGQNPLTPLRHTSEEVLALALAASDMPRIPATQEEDAYGRAHTVEGLENSLAAWFDQGIERLGGTITAHLLAYTAREINHSRHQGHATEWEEDEFLGLWDTPDRQEQAVSLSLAVTVIDDEGMTLSPLPDYLDSFHRALMRAALDTPTRERIERINAGLGCPRCR